MELRLDVVIDAPPAAAWAVLGERFGQIGEWASPITTSTLDGDLGIGAVRTCHIAGFGPVAAGVVRERLIEFDAERMSLAYESVDGLPSSIERAYNRLSVHAHGENRCEVRARARIELRGLMRLVSPFFGWRMQVNAARVLQELRHEVEHGRPHPRKLLTNPIRNREALIHRLL
jgi:hypothetical protein